MQRSTAPFSRGAYSMRGIKLLRACSGETGIDSAASSLARKASRGGGELLVLSAAALNRACCSVMYSFLYFGLGGGVTALATLSAAEKPVETGTGICGRT